MAHLLQVPVRSPSPVDRAAACDAALTPLADVGPRRKGLSVACGTEGSAALETNTRSANASMEDSLGPTAFNIVVASCAVDERRAANSDDCIWPLFVDANALTRQEVRSEELLIFPSASA